MPETPQAIDPMGKKLYWCSCGEFITTTPESLSSHVSSFHRRQRILRAVLSLAMLTTFGGMLRLLGKRGSFLHISLVVTLLAIPCCLLRNSIASKDRKRRFENKEGKKERSIVQRDPKILNEIQKCRKYNPANSACLKRFENIKRNTHCFYAARAKIWGGHTCKMGTMEKDVKASSGAFFDFANASDVDAFLFEIENTGGEWKEHGRAVYKLLVALGKMDPTDLNVMEQPLEGHTWRFQWDDKYFFITTFAACYPSNHPRFAFRTGPNSYILFQPGSSFTRHRVTAPIRQAIKENFKRNGRRLYSSAIQRHAATVAVLPIDLEEPHRGSKSENFITDPAKGPGRWWP